MDEQEKLVEEAALKVLSEDEIRSKVIEDFGFDETTDSDRIDKLVAKEKAQRELTSKAIQQKIKHRNDAEELRKKIEAESKKNTPPEQAKDKDLSSADIVYLAKAPISEYDMDEVVNYAKKMGVSVKEAHEHYKPILKVREEERKTADVTNTGPTRRVHGSPSGEELLDKARKGEIPENDEEISKLVQAKFPTKKK